MAKTNAARILEDQTQTAEPTVVVGEGMHGSEVKTDDKGRKTEVRYSMEEIDQKGLKNKSQIIRFLASENHSPSAIAKFLGIRYQFVRNVLNQPLKRT